MIVLSRYKESSETRKRIVDQIFREGEKQFERNKTDVLIVLQDKILHSSKKKAPRGNYLRVLK